MTTRLSFLWLAKTKLVVEANINIKYLVMRYKIKDQIKQILSIILYEQWVMITNPSTKGISSSNFKDHVRRMRPIKSDEFGGLLILEQHTPSNNVVLGKLLFREF
jgi:hypothetical protein